MLSDESSTTLWCDIFLKVSIVGVVRKVEMSATNIVYLVDDMTAPPMEVRQWIESDVSPAMMQWEGSANIILSDIFSPRSRL